VGRPGLFPASLRPSVPRPWGFSDRVGPGAEASAISSCPRSWLLTDVESRFFKRRSFANAISTGGSGLGGLTYSLATNAMIANLGLAWAFRILAIVSFIVNFACSLAIRDRNKAVGAVHVAFHWVLFKHLEFWFFLSWGFFGIISYTIVVFSIADYAMSMGFSAGQGSIAAAVFNRKILGIMSLSAALADSPSSPGSVPGPRKTSDRPRQRQVRQDQRGRHQHPGRCPCRLLPLDLCWPDLRRAHRIRPPGIVCGRLVAMRRSGRCRGGGLADSTLW